MRAGEQRALAGGGAGRGVDRVRAGHVDVGAGQAIGEKPVGAMEPLAIVVERAVAGVRDQQAPDRDAQQGGRRLPGGQGARAAVAAVGANDEVERAGANEAVRGAEHGYEASCGVLRKCLQQVAGGGGDGGAEQEVEFRPAYKGARLFRERGEREVHQDRAVGEAGGPARPGPGCGAKCGVPGRGVEAERLHAVGTHVQAGARIRRVRRVCALEHCHVVPGRYTEGFGEQAAGHPGADDGDAHECA